MEEHVVCKAAIDILDRQESALHFTLQNAAEFWNLATRPATRNGYGHTLSQALIAWEPIDASMTLLPDNDEVYRTWRVLVQTHQVRGVQVHDARLAAAMLVHNVPRILTLNTADFARYTGLTAVHPQEV